MASPVHITCHMHFDRPLMWRELFYVLTPPSCSYLSSWENHISKKTRRLTPVAGPIFETKIESFSLESFFLERNYCPRSLFSGSNACSILSNQVNSWNESRADPCPHSGGYIAARTCSLFGNEGTPQISNASFWKRGRENVFVQMF